MYPPERARRKLTLASTVAAIGAFLFGSPWIGNRRGQRRGEAEACFNMGIALAAQGKRDKALAELRAASRLRPDDAAAHNLLGWTLFAQGKLEEAVAEYREATRLRPDDVGGHAELASILEMEGRLEEAIAEFRAVVLLNPVDARAHYHLGVARMKQGNQPEAVVAFREARDRAQPGSGLARRIESAMAGRPIGVYLESCAPKPASGSRAQLRIFRAAEGPFSSSRNRGGLGLVAAVL